MHFRSTKQLVLCLGTVLLASLSSCEGSSKNVQDRALRGADAKDSMSLVRDVDGSTAEADQYAPSNRGERKLFSWFSLLFLLNPCEHEPHYDSHKSDGGPLWKHWNNHCNGGKGKGGDEYGDNDSDGNEANGVQDYSDASSGEASVSVSGANQASSFKSNWWIWAIAGAAVVAAMVAVVFGQRKREAETHPLKGSVGRRMSLFSNFADSACGGGACGGKNSVEMVSTEGDYKLT